jgi:putative ATPase
LLTWEALRRAPEGGVVALARTAQDAEALRQQAERLPAIERPTILQGELDALPALLQTLSHISAPPSDPLTSDPLPSAPLSFDAILGRNALTRHADKVAAIRLLASLLSENGRLSLAETVPAHTQRLYRLVDLAALGEHLTQRVAEAEEAIYSQADDPMVNWNEQSLQLACEAAGLAAQVSSERERSEVQVTPAMLARWFTPAGSGERPSYVDRLRQRLDAAQCAQVEAAFRQQLSNRAVPWETSTAYLIAGLP